MTIETAPSPTSVAANQGRPKRRGWLLAGAFWVLTLSAIAFNAYWYWRNSQPVPTLPTISGWIRAERYAEAESALREQLRRSPRDGEARSMLARVLAARKDMLGCARELAKIPEWWPGKAEAHLRAGQAYLMVDRAQDAEREFLAVVNSDALHPAPLSVLHDAANAVLEIYATEDRWDEAHPVFWRIYDNSPPENRLPILVLRMKSELERVSASSAIGQIKKYVAADPTDWNALRALALAERQLAMRTEAMAHIKQCLDRRPDDPRIWRDYLSMLHESGDIKAVLAAVAEVPKPVEAAPEIWIYRALACEKKSDWAGAARAYRAAIERNPYVPEYHYKLGMAEKYLGHPQEQKAQISRSQELAKARGQLGAAWAEFFEAREKPGPDGKALRDAHNRLSSLCATLGWTRAAEAWKELANQPF